MEKIVLSTGLEVKMREPKVKDIRAVSHMVNEKEMEFTLIGNLTGLTQEEIDELSFKDYGLLSKELQGFLS